MTQEGAVEFVYELNGTIEQLDVNELAPTLLALGQLIQDSNRIINPEGPRIGVSVKPFRPGSFVVDFVAHPNVIQKLLNFASSPEYEQVKKLLELLGLVAKGIGIPSVISVILFLRGRPKKVEEVGPGQVRYTSYDDRSITVNGEVHQLLQDNSIHNTLVKVYVQPLENPDVTEVKTYVRGEESTAVTVPKQEGAAIRAFATSKDDPHTTTKEVLHSGVFLNPKRGSFDDDPKDWSFHRGEEVITATIRDKQFLDEYARGEKRLNHNDLLVVDLLEKQKVVGTRVQKPVYEIVRVTDYTKADTVPMPSTSQTSTDQQ